MKEEQILSSKKNLKHQSELWEVIADAMSDNNADEIVMIDLREVKETVTDFFIICHGNSTTQVKGIADKVHEKVKDITGELPVSKEGIDKANWIVIDYFDVVAHVFMRETRGYYEIEDLWGDRDLYTYDPKFKKLIRQDGK